MAIITGLLKDKLGNTFYPQTSFAKVVDADSKTLATWRSETDASLAVLNALVDESGLLKMEKMPEILQHNKGNFANEAALPSTGEAGDYAINTETDTVWIWDAEKSGGAGWVDTGKKGNVTSVNGKTGDVVIAITDIDGLQTAIDAKVSTSSIVDDLTTGGTAVPLSAEQGKTLKGLVDTAQSTATAAQSAAGTAQSAAEAAQSTADGAQSAAEAAQSTASGAQTAAETAQTEAEKVDFAVVEHGAAAPTTLRDDGLYFEKDA